MSTNSSSRKLTRREFIRLAAGFGGAALLASCAPAPAPTTAPTSAPAAAATAVPATKAAVATSVPVPTVVPTAKAPVEITWWRSLAGTNGTELEAMVKDFNASQKAVIVKSEYQGVYADLRDKLTAAAAAGGSAMPDVVLLADTMYRNFAVNKRLEPLDDLIKGPNGVEFADYYGLVERGKLDGVYYQLPIACSTPVLYYNIEALKQAGFDGPPKTWDEFFNSYVPKLTIKDSAGKTRYGFVHSIASPDWWWLQCPIWTYGGDMSDEKWNVFFDSPVVIDVLTRFQNLFKAGQAYIPTKADGDALTVFGSGLGAMLIESTGVLVRVDDAAAKKFTAGVAYLPGGPAGQKLPTGGAGLCLIAGRPADKKAAAWEFIRWMSQPAQVARFSKVSGYLPFTKKAADAMSDVMKQDPRRKVAVDQLQFSRGQSPIQTLPRAADMYYDAMVQVMNLKADPKVIMPQIQKQIQQIIVEEGLKK